MGPKEYALAWLEQRTVIAVGTGPLALKSIRALDLIQLDATYKASNHACSNSFCAASSRF